MYRRTKSDPCNVKQTLDLEEMAAGGGRCNMCPSLDELRTPNAEAIQCAVSINP